MDKEGLMATGKWGQKRKMMNPVCTYLGNRERRCGHLFLDSGAHSLYGKFVLSDTHRKDQDRYRFYQTKTFWKYVDDYAAFVKKYQEGIDLYVTVDAIYNPEISWKVLKYLENEHGLAPVPVIHARTPLHWVDKHLDAGYKRLGVGGLGQEESRHGYTRWADKFFAKICPGPDHLPVVKVHGFAMTSHTLIRRYPWHSCDSSTWAKAAAFGGIFVPKWKNGGWDFSGDPNVVFVGNRSRFRSKKRKHYWNMTAGERKVVDRWLAEINIPLGTVDADNNTQEKGVTSQYNHRSAANVHYFRKFVASLPKWPWPFTLTGDRGFFK